MKLRSLSFLCLESLKNLLRNGWMTFASVSAVTVTLLMLGIFLIVTMNVNHMSREVEKSIEIRVHVEVTATPEETEALSVQLKAIPEVESVAYSSKEDELKMMEESFGSDIYELLEQTNPLNDIYTVKLKDPEQIEKVAERIKPMSSAEKVIYGKEYIDEMFKFLGWGRQVGFGLILAFAFVAVFLIANTIRITIISRKREIEIMRLVGATNAFIRWPFFLEGIWLGILGSIIPIATIAIGYTLLRDTIGEVNIGFVSLLEPWPFVYHISWIIIGIGTGIGVAASILSIRKYIKV